MIHNEKRTFQSICKYFWLIFLHLFMKIWTRVSLHLWSKFWCFFKVPPHLCKALVCFIYDFIHLILQKKMKWGNPFFGHEKNYPYTPGKHICFFWKSLRGIGPSQLLSMAPPTIQQCFNLLQHRSWILGQLGKQEDDETFDTAIFRSSTPRVAL